MRIPIPYHAPHSNTAQYGCCTMRTMQSPCTPALSHRPLQLARRASNTGATMRHMQDRTILQDIKPNVIRGLPGLIDLNGPGTSPRSLAQSPLPCNTSLTRAIFLLFPIQIQTYF